ncbi:glycosyltransferase family 25 protein [Avibacterium avium]|uniref:glycosyltransferase family 25 protein n=1 Tax=Avibacterium avium TaxID=751 RepID=UPI003BF8E667
MNIFVISLKDNNSIRKEHMLNEFSKCQLNFTFFDAVIPKDINYMANKLDINIETTSLTQGEIACLLSHLCLWDKMIKSDMDRIAIFEDDIYLSKSINSILENVKLNNVNFDILKLEKSLDYISVYKRNRLDLISSDKCKIYRLKSQHLGAAGYVITKKGAEKICL